MEGIPSRICWHDIVGNIDGHGVRNGFIHRQQRYGCNQGKRVVFPWEGPDFEFFNNLISGGQIPRSLLRLELF